LSTTEQPQLFFHQSLPRTFSGNGGARVIAIEGALVDALAAEVAFSPRASNNERRNANAPSNPFLLFA
jgi:hypothetical protein